MWEQCDDLRALLRKSKKTIEHLKNKNQEYADTISEYTKKVESYEKKEKEYVDTIVKLSIQLKETKILLADMVVKSI